MNRMYGIRWLVLLLCLVLTLAVFVACDSATSSGDTTTAGEETTDALTEAGDGVSIRISDYTVLVSEHATDSVNAAAIMLVNAAQDQLGAEFKSIGDDFVTNVSDIDPNACEILVGATNRPESSAALEELNGAVGFVVKKVGNKIVVNASANELVDEAVQYFITEYVSKGNGGAFSVPEELSYLDTDIGGVSLLDDKGRMQFELVYSSELDTTKGTNQYDRVDYVINYFMDLRMGLVDVIGLDDVPFSADDVKEMAGSKEVLLGRTNRKETQAFLETLAPNEYGYGVMGNKLIITGWSDYTIGKAIELFARDMEKYVVDNGSFKNLVLLESDKVVEAHSEWNVDVPLYDGGDLDGVVELLNNSYEAYYINTTPEEYKAYCADLATKGYRTHQTNQIGNNLYGTYTDGKNMIHVYYVDYLGAVRFITESMKTAILPQNEDPYEKITETTFTTFDFDSASGNWGNCFIITLEDGSFILHDGGGADSNRDPDELYSLLTKLNKREDGKIVIAAWIISHQHYDHFMNSYNMVKKYYKNNVTVEKILFNVPSASFEYNSMNPNAYYKDGYFHNVRMWTGAEHVVMHTGQTIQIRNLKIELIYSADDIYPAPPVKFNNTAFVTRFDIGEGANKQKYMIVGDAEEVACKIMCDMYKEELKCDMISVAHHGSGGSIDLYAFCKPKIVVWPHTQERVNQDLAKGKTGYYPEINQSLCNQKNVLIIVVSDYGHKTFSLPLLGLTENRTANHDNLVTIWPREDGLTH